MDGQKAREALARLRTADMLLGSMGRWGWLDRLFPAAAALLRRGEMQDGRRATEAAQTAVRALLRELRDGADGRLSAEAAGRLEEFADLDLSGPALGQPLRLRIAESRARIAAAGEAIRAACGLPEEEPDESRLPGVSRDKHRN